MKRQRGRGRKPGGGGGNFHHNNQGGHHHPNRQLETNGPDTKFRGTASYIHERYLQLARDAQSSGDRVLGENYLQHAEHYNRIIMAFREQQMAQGGGDIQNGAGRPRPPGFGEPVAMGDDFSEDEFGAEGQPQQLYSPPARSEGGHQRHEGQRFEGGGRPFHNRDRGDRDRGERFQRGDRQERYERPERIDRADRPDRAPQPDVGLEAQPPRRERTAVPHHEQPEFLRRPVRRPRRETAASDDEAAAAPTPAVEGSGD